MTLELIARGRSYGSMFLAGGVCFLLIGHLGKVRPRLPVAGRMLVGAGIVTMVELAAGLIVNRDYGVWDYRDQIMNFMGQICPMFSLLWIPVSLLAILLYEGANRLIDSHFGKKPSPDLFPGMNGIRFPWPAADLQ